jgi:hypothetical protein
MWKIWPIKNYEWIKKIHPTLDGKNEKENKEMKNLDENPTCKIMDENLPFG